MNIIVCLETPSSTFELSVSPSDDVSKVKEKVRTSQQYELRDASLFFNEVAMEDSKTLEYYGIVENSHLTYRVNMTPDILAAQLAHLLRVRELSLDELGLLYCYKYGTSLQRVLRLIDVPSASEFISSREDLVFVYGNVRCVSVGGLQQFSVAREIELILRAHGGQLDITTLCSKFVQKFNVTISSIVNMRPAEFLSDEPSFIFHGRGLVKLRRRAPNAPNHAPAAAQAGPQNMKNEDSRSRTGAEIPPGLDIEESVRGTPSPINGGMQCEEVTLPRNPKVDRLPNPTPESLADISKTIDRLADPMPESDDPDKNNDQAYRDLHAKIASPAFHSRVTQIVRYAVQIVASRLFLNIREIVIGGSVAKGTSISDGADASVVFFVHGLPQSGFSRWLPRLLKSVASILTEGIDTGTIHLMMSDIQIHQTSVSMRLDNVVDFHVSISPVFASYAATIQCLGEQDPDVRPYFKPALAKEKVMFICRQPSHTKMTIQLLKWWREQQDWPRDIDRPSDDILELVAVYAWLRTQPTDQRIAIAHCMSLMARFDQLRVVWTNFYGKEDIWKPLIQQRPLLMDPVSPFHNVTDPQVFNPQKLQELSKNTCFFW
eukprot:GEMP01019681.1.p1 GENE.GEMP01019681.1~~GEMP01019681.1.p1  ORF type:complete len:603 (+),score=85.67 GEMP01019681.1:62-1870(+)